jgi:hypothetical protein
MMTSVYFVVDQYIGLNLYLAFRWKTTKYHLEGQSIHLEGQSILQSENHRNIGKARRVSGHLYT